MANKKTGDLEIGGRLFNTATGNIVAGADAIKDEVKGKTQAEINVETYEHVADINAALQELSPDQTEALALATDVVNLKEDVDQGAVFDVSEKYPTSGVEGGNTYTLEGALAVLNANLPASKKKGGMIFKFVQSSDNKYVQYFLTKNVWSASEADWEKMNLEEEISQLDQKVGNIDIKNNVITTSNLQEMLVLDNANDIMIEKKSTSTATFTGNDILALVFDGSEVVALPSFDNNILSYKASASKKNKSCQLVVRPNRVSSAGTLEIVVTTNLYKRVERIEETLPTLSGNVARLTETKTIVLQYWSSSVSLINENVDNGRYFFNSYDNKVNLKIADSNYVDVDYDYNTIYLYNGKTYVYNGVGLELLEASLWKNHKWACIGDSLTDGNTTNTTKRYYDYIHEQTGIQVVDMGISGSGYMRDYEVAEGENAFYQRVETIPFDCDIVTIFGSFNDIGGGYTMGQPDDTGVDTIAGCINRTIDRIINRFLNNGHQPPVIGIISPTPWINKSNDVTEPSNDSAIPNSGQYGNYVNLLQTISARKSIPFLNLWVSSNLHPNNELFRQRYYSKDPGTDREGQPTANLGVHPNELGHALIATKMLPFLESILVNF